MGHSLIQIKVRGYHVDAFGVVNHAWFVRFFEEARWAYLDERPALRNGLHLDGVTADELWTHPAPISGPT
jgi:acyl-CoA thioesterase FadM